MEYYHLGELVHKKALTLKHKTALKYQSANREWVNLSWKNFSDKIMKLAQSMAEIGLQPNDNVGIYAQNMEKYLITDFAAYANKAVMVPMYATSSPMQIRYIIHDAESGSCLWVNSFSITMLIRCSRSCPSWRGSSFLIQRWCCIRMTRHRFISMISSPLVTIPNRWHW